MSINVNTGQIANPMLAGNFAMNIVLFSLDKI